MVVKAQTQGRNLTGLRISSHNVKRYFPRESSSVELQLDHLHIACDLDPAFWMGHPEILDRRLQDWLEAKQAKLSGDQKTFDLVMVPSGEHSFRVEVRPHLMQAGQSSSGQHPGPVTVAVA